MPSVVSSRHGPASKLALCAIEAGLCAIEVGTRVLLWRHLCNRSRHLCNRSWHLCNRSWHFVQSKLALVQSKLALVQPKLCNRRCDLCNRSWHLFNWYLVQLGAPFVSGCVQLPPGSVRVLARSARAPGASSSGCDFLRDQHEFRARVPGASSCGRFARSSEISACLPSVAPLWQSRAAPRPEAEEGGGRWRHWAPRCRLFILRALVG